MTTATQISTTVRTHHCNELRPEHIGQPATLAGWVDSYRGHGGGLVFIDLRDRCGKTQVVFDLEDAPDRTILEAADKLRGEDVIRVSGHVRRRDGGPNPRLETGEIELVAERLEVLNKAVGLPFQPTDLDNLPKEEIRLQRRYLDLRRPEMQKILRTRHEVAQSMRRYLDKLGFLEIETPILCKSTPEGARDFLVPSRLQPGEFYALPQSPQLFKQILMVAGADRYFQIARCFRDEDPRADRQAEFTQLDIEMSFVGVEDIISMTSDLFRKIWKDVLDHEIGEIPTMTYAQCMTRYGSDRPDTRFEMELTDLSDLAARTEFKVFTGAVAEGGVVQAIVARDASERMTRKITDGYAPFVQQFGLGGLPVVKLTDGAFTTGVAKFLEPIAGDLKKRLGLRDGDVVFFGVGPVKVAQRGLGELRLRIARDLGIIPEGAWNFLWVVDFPMIEWNEGQQRWDSLHHPFTAPNAEDIDKLDTAPGEVLSQAYDIVVNGSEIGGGSIRIHSPEVQSKVFSLLGISEKEAEIKFGFLLDALRHGAPPHGGIAAGLDRVVMHLCGTDNIRDVIAFPKTQTGADLMTEAPGEASEAQLAELHIKSTFVRGA
jgi:aspartyl-tRNA synthetase